MTELFGEFIRDDLFYSEQYIRKLIAKGCFESYKRKEKVIQRYLIKYNINEYFIKKLYIYLFNDKYIYCLIVGYKTLFKIFT